MSKGRYLLHGLVANLAISCAFFLKGWTASSLGVPIGLLIGLAQGLFVVWLLHGSESQERFYRHNETPAPADNNSPEVGA